MLKKFYAGLTLILCLLFLYSCIKNETLPENPSDNSTQTPPPANTIYLTYYETLDSESQTVAYYGGYFKPSVNTRFGYTYKGLFDMPEGGNMIFDSEGVPIVSVESSTTLYYQWEPWDFTISLLSIDSEGNKGVIEANDKTVAVKYEQVLTVLPTPEPPYRYKFIGWKSLEGEMVSDGGIVKEEYKIFNLENYPRNVIGMPSALTPVFELLVLDVTFEYQDENYENKVLKKVYGDELLTNELPRRSDGTKMIKGWSTDPYEYKPVSTKSLIFENTTLYAFWVNYNSAVMHSGIGANTTSASIREDEDFDLVQFTSQFVKKHHTAVGWYENSDFFGEKVTEIVYTTQGETKDYYLKWVPNVYTITFDEETAGGEIAPIVYTYGETFSLPTPTYRRGYKFWGWCDNKEMKGMWISKVTPENAGNYTLYAEIKPNSYKITLDANGGNCDNESVDVNYDSNFTLPIPIKKDIRLRGGIQMKI